VQKTTKKIELDAAAERCDEDKSQNHGGQGMLTHSMSGELRFHGARGVLMNPLAMCDKLDKIFGTGAEAIVHHMWFESGRDAFDTMIRSNQDKNHGELLKMLVDLQPCTGWGFVSLTILRADPPMVDIVVKNPPVKAMRGSQRQIIGSYWAGVLSRYYNRQLVSKNTSYDVEKDEFSCKVTV